MKATVKELTKEEAKQFLDGFRVDRQIPVWAREKFMKMGWTFLDYSMEKVYKGYFLVIEFCIGDYCTYPCSKNGHWVLEKKVANEDFWTAYVEICKLEERIDADEHWTGEND